MSLKRVKIKHKNILQPPLFMLSCVLCLSFSYIKAQNPEVVLSIGPGDVSCLDFNYNGTILASSVISGKIIHLWDVKTGMEIRSILTDEEVKKISFHPKDNRLFCYQENSDIAIWDIDSGKKTTTIKGINESFDFCPDGLSLVKLVNSNAGFEELISDLSDYNIDSKIQKLDKITHQDDAYDIEIIDIQTGKLINSFNKKGYASVIKALPDGKRVACYCPSYDTNENSIIKIFEIEKGEELLSFSVPKQKYPDNPEYSGGDVILTFSPDGEFLCSASNEDSVIFVFDLESKKIATRLSGHMMAAYDNQEEKNPNRKYQTGTFCLNFIPYTNLLISSGRDEVLKIREIPSGKEIMHLKPFIFPYSRPYPIFTFGISPDGKVMAAGNCDGQEIGIINLKNGNVITRIKGLGGKQINGIAVDIEDKCLIVSDNGINIWDMKKAIKIRTLPGHAPFSLDHKTNYLACNQMSGFDTISKSSVIDYRISDHKFLIWDIKTGKLKCEFPQNRIGSFIDHMDYKGKYIAAGYGKGMIKVWNSETGKLFYTFKKGKYSINGISINAKKNILVASGSEDAVPLSIWNLANGEEVKTIYPFDINSDFNEVEFSPDGNLLAASAGYGIRFWETENWKEVKGIWTSIYKITFSPDSKMIAGVNDKLIQVWNVKTGTEVCKCNEHTEQIQAITFVTDNLLLSGGNDHKIKLWDINRCRKIVDFIDCGKDNYLTITSDNFYTLSKGASEAVGFRLNNKIFPIEQFDLQYNRPDIVLERIGFADTALINAYRKAYYKRLKKMKVNESMFSPDFHMPETVILNSDDFSYTSDARLMTLKVKFSDSKKKLNRFNVWINDVPMYGMNGVNISNLHSDSLIEAIPLELSAGENKIQVSCINENYVESLKDQIWIKCNDTLTKPDLYFIDISISEYQNSKKNLQYALKDGRDMEELFHSSGTVGAKWNHVYTDTLFNQTATKSNLYLLKSKLFKTNVDDQVILFFSGHGVLDDSLNLYLAGYDMDFSKPGLKGIPYDMLEWMFDSIPARNKLLLIDACQSGEVDKDLKYFKVKSKTINETLVLKGDSINYKYSYLGLHNSFELMKELFANIDKGTGAVVISASGGLESALESNTWGNGAFTYSILNGLGKMDADADKNGIITVGELKNYVGKEVEILTSGRQTPTTRKENLSNDFIIWKK